MTDDLTPKTPPRTIQRLDGPDALLTAEWTIPDFDGDAPPSVRPTPPSQRQAGVAAAARPGAAGPLKRTVTVPRKPRFMSEPPPPVVVAADLGATLPPRAERELREAIARELPSVERPAPRAISGWSTKLSGRRSLVTAGILFLMGAAWASSALLPSTDEGGPKATQLPAFLSEAAAATPPAPPGLAAASTGELPHVSGALPPELAATLAQALPSAPEQHALLADAGVPASTAEAAAPEARPEAPIPVATETRDRAEALRAVLEAQQRQSVRPKSNASRAPRAARPGAKTAPRTAAAEHSNARSSARGGDAADIVTDWTNDLPQNPKVEAPPRGQKHEAPPTSTTDAQDGDSSRSIRPLTTYTYEPKALFSVATAPMRVTDLVLEPGEKLVSQPTAGDAARWVITVMPGESQSHVFVKPLRAGLRTNLTLTTNRRSYFLELSTRDDGSYMAGVVWQYPHDEAARRQAALAEAARERQSSTAVADLQALRFDYRIDVIAGEPSWKPTAVFDDGQKTFIRFAKPITSASAPLLFVLRAGSTKNANFVNYRVKRDLFVIDQVVESAELQLEQPGEAVEVVRITRHR